MATALERLRRLESMVVDRYREPRRVFTCVVRDGSEEEDRIRAMAALGLLPDPDDFTIIHVVVAPKGQSLEDVRPWASVSENNRRIFA